jgi:MFS family permease
MRQGENAMFEILDRRTSLTGNQIKILTAAIIGDALEFFDYFLIGFVLAFLIGPWKLTFGQSAVVLMSSGIGAILGAYIWGWLADRIGRRKVFIGTVLNFSIATGLLYFTPDNGWIYLSVMRFFVGLGVGGLYCVDLPLVQEFMPSSKRGWVGGIVTCVIPLGVGLGAVMGSLVGSGQWRLLFAIGVLPALLVLLVRLWVPESPRWLCRQGRYEEARNSLAWALQMQPSTLPLPTAADAGPIIKSNWLDLFKYPRSLIVSWLGNAGAQTGVYGLTLWAPSLFVLLLKVTPQEAAKMMILLSVSGFIGRQRRRPARLWRGGHDHRGRLQLRRDVHGCIGVLAAVGRDLLFRRRRLRDRRALCGGSLALTPQDLGHGLGLWLRRHRQDYRAGRPRPDRGIRQLSQARRAPATDSNGLRLSRLLVSDGRDRVLFPWH